LFFPESDVQAHASKEANLLTVGNRTVKGSIFDKVEESVFNPFRFDQSLIGSTRCRKARQEYSNGEENRDILIHSDNSKLEWDL
jgi:hypothetical protein